MNSNSPHPTHSTSSTHETRMGSPGKKTALITGASSGIGSDLAEIFARDGFNLILVARSTDRLEKLASALAPKHSVHVRVVTEDLSQPHAAEKLLRKLSPNPESQDLGIDVLVNNAGFGMQGNFWKIPIETHRRMMQLNILTLTELTQLILPEMIRRGSGRILNVASTAAYQPGPFLAVYYATKAYVLSFSEALANELRGTGVTVTTLCPGPTKTGFQQVAGIQDLPMLKTPVVMASRPVAEKGYKALMRGKTVEIPGFLNKAAAFSTRFAPRSVMAQVARKFQEGK